MSRRRLGAIAMAVVAAAAVLFGVQQFAFADTNLALGKAVTVSSTDNTANAAGNAVDGNAGTRWSSAYSDPQWIAVDLGSAQTITSVKLSWEAAYGRSFRIQTSNDNSTWTDRFSTTSGTGGTQTITIPATSARYVRVYGTQRGTIYGYSLWEFEVYGGTATGTNAALGRPVTVSSTDDASNAAGNAVDGNAATRWSSAYSDPQWIAVDLGSAQTVTSVRLRWEAAFGRSYRIQTSNDNSTWADRYTTTTGAGGTETIAVPATSARYVRLYGTQRGTAYGYSLWEFEVYVGGTAPMTPPATTPPPPAGGPDLTGFALQRSYLFGSGAGRNTSNLSTDFNPYGIAGQAVINGEWQRYQSFNSTNHHITADRLELTATPNLGGIFPGGISSGQITTKETFYPRNGRTYVFQVRAKIPHGSGAWPAFWFYAKGDPHTASEIDVFEFFDTPTQNTFDWTGYDHGDGVGSDYHNIMTNQWVWHPGFDFAADYHTYSLVWREGQIEKWVDNNWVKGTNFTWNGSDPQILINLAIGGGSNNNPDAATFPSVYSVDFLKVWKK
jgi:NedA-like, galactose-binding domain/Glycosyl hydrolases family 16